jgi:hypothetical protein
MHASGRMPGRWQSGQCRMHGRRCLDPVLGYSPTPTELRRGWRRALKVSLL